MAATVEERDAAHRFGEAFLDLIKSIENARSSRVSAEHRRQTEELSRQLDLRKRTDSLPQPLLVSAKEAASRMAISTGTLWNMTAPRGPLPVVKIGTRRCYAIRDLEAAIERLKVHAT